MTDLLRWTSLAGMALFVSCTTSFAQERVKGLPVLPVVWRNVGPGGGGWIETVLASQHAPDRFWVGCDVGGVYRSEDAGKSYVTLNQGLGNLFIETLCEHPLDQNVILAGSIGGIFKSVDGGRNWRDIRTGLPSVKGSGYGVKISEIVSVPGRPDSFWATTGLRRCGGSPDAGQIYRSDDSGETWRAIVRTGLPSKVAMFALSPDPRRPEHLLLSTDKGVFRSVDAGVNWEPSNEGLRNPAHARVLARAKSNPDVLYLSTLHLPGNVPWAAQPYRSADGGRTWQPCGKTGLQQRAGRKGENRGFTSFYNHLAVHPENPDEVYLCGATWVCEGVWKSTDAGQTWRQTFSKKSIQSREDWIKDWGPDIHSLTVSPYPPYAISFGTEGYIYRSEDRAETWSQRYTRTFSDGRSASVGLEVTCAHAINPDPTRKGRFYLNYYDIGLLRSDDGGQSMKHLMPRKKGFDVNDCFSVVCDKMRPDHIWGSFGDWGASTKGYLGESFDAGETWRLFRSGGWNGRKSPSFAVVGENTPRTIYAACAGGEGLVVSRDGGETWQTVSTNVCALAREVTSVIRFGDRLYLKAKNRILRTDLCLGNNQVVFAERVGSVGPFCVEGRRMVVGCRDRWDAKTKTLYPGGVWLSVDDGLTWRRIYKDPYIGSVLLTAGWILVGPYDNPYHDRDNGGGVLASEDDGATWVTLNTPSLHNWNATTLSADPFDPLTIWNGTHGNSVFVTRLPHAGKGQ